MDCPQNGTGVLKGLKVGPMPSEAIERNLEVDLRVHAVRCYSHQRRQSAGRGVAEAWIGNQFGLPG